MGWISDQISGGYKFFDTLAGGGLPGGAPMPGDPLRSEISRGYLNPQSTEAYKAAAQEAAAKSAEARAMTNAAYADRGLGQSGYAAAAGQQVGMNEQRALSDAIQDIQARYLSEALGMRGQDLQRSAAREQALTGLFGDLLGTGGNVAGAAFGKPSV